eukprot:CFRG2607T1
MAVQRDRVPRVIGITGPSCVGKTTVANALAGMRKCACTTILHQDDFYKNIEEVPTYRDNQPNWEVLGALDIPRIAETLKTMRENIQLKSSAECALRHSACDGPLVIVEGLHIHDIPEITKQLDTIVALFCGMETVVSRRIQRDYGEYEDPKDYLATVLTPSCRDLLGSLNQMRDRANISSDFVNFVAIECSELSVGEVVQKVKHGIWK